MKLKAKNSIKFAVLAADVALFTIADKKLLVRLVKANRPPHFPGVPAIPGGLIHPTETADQAVERIIQEKAGVKSSKAYFEQFYTFSTVDRDPRGRVVSVAYFALVPWEQLSAIEQSSTDDMWWEVANRAPKLAYDHDDVLWAAIRKLRSMVVSTTISLKIIPKEFTLTHLENTCEIILGKDIDKRNFRRKLQKLGVVKKVNRKLRGVKHRPPDLYAFASQRVMDIPVL